MDQLWNLVELIAVLMYAAFIIIPKSISKNTYLVGDLLMGIVLVSLLLNDNSSPLLIISLLWLGCNYLNLLPHKNPKWMAYDGFAVATVLSQMKLNLL